MSKVFLSIIIPTYNAEKTIKECLKSILNQEYKNYEVLILDGASNDQTLDIIRSFASEYIKIFSAPDKGIYDAMNKGLALAKGEWLYFLGSDDELYDNDVLSKVRSVTTKNMLFIYGNVIFNNTGESYCGKLTDVEILSKNICQQAIFYNRSLFEILKFNLRYKVFADHDLNIKIFDKYYLKIHFENLFVAKYSNQGFSSTQSDEFINDITEVRANFKNSRGKFFSLKYNLYFYQNSLAPSRFRGLLLRVFNFIST